MDKIKSIEDIRNLIADVRNKRKEITPYYEAENEMPAGDFRKAIGNTLPRYMILVVYNHLPELKRNPNGKIDRLYYSKLVEE